MTTDKIELVNVLAAAHSEIQRLKAEVECLQAENEKLRVAVAEAAKAVYQLTKVLNGGLV